MKMEDFTDMETTLEFLKLELTKIVSDQLPSAEVISAFKKLVKFVDSQQNTQKLASQYRKKFAKQGGAELLLGYMKALSKNAIEDLKRGPARECYDEVKNLCWDAAFQCARLWKDYGNCGLLTFLAKELKLIKEERKEQDLQWHVATNVNIMHNCTSEAKNISILQKTTLLRNLVWFRRVYRLAQISELSISCAFLMAKIVTEEQVDILRSDENLIQDFFENLCFGIKESDLRCAGRHVDGYLEALRNLAKNKINGTEILKHVLNSDILALITEKGTHLTKKNALRLVCQLSFINVNKTKMIASSNINDFLGFMKLDKSDKKGTSQKLTTLAYQILNDAAAEMHQEDETEKKLEKMGLKNNNLMMICYANDGKDIAEEIRKYLSEKKPHYEVFLEGVDKYDNVTDQRDNTGRIRSAFAAVVCLSDNFKESVYCRAVAEYFYHCGKNCIIPVLIDTTYNPHGWLYFLIDNPDTNKYLVLKDDNKSEILQKIEEKLSKCSDEVSGSESSEATSSSEKAQVQQEGQPSSSKHVMISYSHAQKELIFKLEEELKKSKYAVWIDKDKMKGNTIDAMQKGIKNSAVFLMCMSKDYEESGWCRDEAEYARKRLDRDDVVPLKVENGYKEDNWLDFLVGLKFYHNISPPEGYNEERHKKLMRELGDRGKK